MNKLGVVLGVAAAVTLAGCMDPNYKKPGERGRNAVKSAAAVKTEQAPAAVASSAGVTPDVTHLPGQGPAIEITTADVTVPSCQCAPGTKHAAPCGCGAPDCRCAVEAPRADATAPASVPAEPETTNYIVQRGDYLAKISKRFNVKLDALRKANPQIKDDKIMIGQTIKIPGRVEVGEQKIPEGAFKKPAVREYKPYSGATRDYVVKSGDTLGAIAYGNGINIRQLKELNGLSGDMIRVGQTLKIPAAPAAAAPAAAPAAAAKPVQAKKPAGTVRPVAESAVEPVGNAVQEAAEKVTDTVDAGTADVEAALKGVAEEGITHIVQEGDDITGLSILYNVDPAEIRDANNLAPADELKPGQVLKIPASSQL